MSVERLLRYSRIRVKCTRDDEQGDTRHILARTCTYFEADDILISRQHQQL